MSGLILNTYDAEQSRFIRKQRSLQGLPTSVLETFRWAWCCLSITLYMRWNRTCLSMNNREGIVHQEGVVCINTPASEKVIMKEQKTKKRLWQLWVCDVCCWLSKINRCAWSPDCAERAVWQLHEMQLHLANLFCFWSRLEVHFRPLLGIFVTPKAWGYIMQSIEQKKIDFRILHCHVHVCSLSMRRCCVGTLWEDLLDQHSHN